MTRLPLVVRPLPLQAPTAFVRIRPTGRRHCGETRRVSRVPCLPARPPRH